MPLRFFTTGFFTVILTYTGVLTIESMEKFTEVIKKAAKLTYGYLGNNFVLNILFFFSAIIIIAFFVLSRSISSAKTEVAKTPTLSQTTPTIISIVNPTEQLAPSPTVSVDQKPTETQIIKAIYSYGKGLWPSEFTVKAGIPVRLEVYAEIDGVGCMGSITVPNLTDSVQYFTKGQTNVFEFTPEKTGEYEITCAMGIPHGSIVVK